MTLILFNQDIFTDLILALLLGFISGLLWGWICRALKL